MSKLDVFRFPCVYSTNELSTWKLEVTVDQEYNVVASGDLIEVEELARSAKNGDTMVNMETSLVNKTNTSNILQDLTNDKMDGNRSVIDVAMRANESCSARTFHFYLSKPTCAQNIGICVGRFKQIIEQPPQNAHAAPNGLQTDDLIVKYYYLNPETYDPSALRFDYLREDATTASSSDEDRNLLDKFIAKVVKQKPIWELIDYFKELLSFKYPHRFYKQVFLEDTSFLPSESDKNNSLLSFSTFTILK